ncbi:MAG: hypothetical protein K0R62_5599 [Nonomuraea muscovyensis]|nr:hypothetical protein [Nonomuraea muscovyensis]
MAFAILWAMGDRQEQWEAAERLALTLAEGGLQRMAARTLAVFLFTDQDSVTAGEIAARNTAFQAMLQAARTGIETTAEHDPAHRRLTQMRDFYEFMLGEIPAMLDRWHRHRQPG